MRMPFSSSLRVFRVCGWAVVLICAVASRAGAQTLSKISNQFVGATVVTDNMSSYGGGQFSISAGSKYGDYLFLYNITSNVVFRVTTPNGVTYYTNSKGAAGGQPLGPDRMTPIANTPFDSVYIAADQIAVIWNNLSGFRVTMRLSIETPASAYAAGSDVLIAFEYEALPNTGAVQLGIFVMLDNYNGQAEGSGGGGDKAAFVTDREYFPTDHPGRAFRAGRDTMPTFIHTGNFRATTPINSVFPIHRLSGTSHEGAALTPPDLFAVGNWRRFRFLSWDVADSDVTITNVGDCASILRWSGLEGKGKVVTAFGMSDKGGNNVYTCRDNTMFVDIRTARLIEQGAKGAPFIPDPIDVTMWVSNTGDTAINVAITPQQPIGAPAPQWLTLDASTPATQTAPLAPRETKQLRWRLRVAGLADTVLTDMKLSFRYTRVGVNEAPRSFKEVCEPIITVHPFSARPPAAKDTLAPVVRKVDRTFGPEYGLRLLLADQHPGYVNDTGLNNFTVASSGNVEVELVQAIVNCDTSKTSAYRVRQLDPTAFGWAIFTVTDCAGNLQTDSVQFTARVTDSHAPVILRNSDGRLKMRYQIYDRHAGFFDTGIDSIIVNTDASFNFRLVDVFPYTRCDTLSDLRFAIAVVDSSRPARFIITIRDCWGNIANDTVVYQPEVLGFDDEASASESTALAITGLRPQPVRAGADATLDVLVRNFEAGALRAEVVAADGRVVTSDELPAEAFGSGAATVRLRMPRTPGVYLIRVSTAAGSAQRKVLVTR